MAIHLPDFREPDPHASEPEAFIAENPFAQKAMDLLVVAAGKQQASEAARNYALRGEAYATLALAFEQRQTRFNMGGIEDRLEEIRNQVSR